MRITPVETGTRPELAEQEARILVARGRVSPLYQVLLNSPAIAHGWEQMLSAVRNHSALDAGVRELVILRVAVLNRAPYEFDAHVPHALAAGCSQADIDATRLQPLPAHAGWSPAAVAALALADAMTRSVQVPDTVFDAVAVHFDAQGKVELVAAIAAYNMVSRFLEALHVGH